VVSHKEVVAMNVLFALLLVAFMAIFAAMSFVRPQD
jgi:hypothetical protein